MRRIGALVLLTAAVLAWPITAATPTAKPEEVGLSSERLHRISELMQRHITAGTFSGAVTLVARNGRIAHFEAQGLMDIESRKPMQKDAIFRIMSMTKPVVGVVDHDDDRGRQGPADRSGLEVHPRAARISRWRCRRRARRAGPRTRSRRRRAALLHRSGRARDHRFAIC